MMNKDQISKGFYQHPQVSNFISVKNYIFLHRAEKQYLLIRFSNDSDFTVHFLRFTILQLDAQNQTLAKSTVQYSDLSFVPGSTHTSSEGLVVDEKCCNFKILYNEVRSDNYHYTIYRDEIVAHYVPSPVSIPVKTKPTASFHRFTVIPQKVGHPTLLAWVAALAIIFCILLNIQHVHTKYADAVEKQRQEEAEQEESQLDSLPAETPDQTQQDPSA